MLRALSLSLSLTLAACGDAMELKADEGGDAEPEDVTDATDVDSGSPDDTGSVLPEASWYAIDAHLDLLAGDLRLEQNTWLRITLYDTEIEAVCAHEVAIGSAAAATPLAGEPAGLGWWELQLEDGVSDTELCPEWAARTLRIGVGPYDPLLDAALAARQTASDPTPFDDALYGLYVQEFDGAPLWIVGIVTMPGLEEAELVAEPPLADGTYEAHSLVLLQYPGLP